MKNATALLLIFGATLLPAQEIKDRERNQQERIAQGVRSGQLTAGETARLERKESAIQKEVRHDRRVNGGNLTNREKAKVARQQNRLSKDIHNQKHDSQTQPK